MYPYENLSLEDMPNEEWRDIKGFENHYQVSNLGRVKSLERIVKYKGYNNLVNKVIEYQKTFKQKILKQEIVRGYLKIQLSNHSKYTKFQVHRLVALTFIGNPNNYPQVNHIDGDTKNNNIKNLEFCTAKQNVNHAIKMGLSNHNKAVNKYNINGKYLDTYESIKDVFERHNKGNRNVETKVFTSDDSKPLFGYLWRLESEEYPKGKNIKPYINKKLIIQFDKQGNKIKEWNNVYDIAKEYNCSHHTIFNVLYGNRKTAKGYIWRYLKDCE